MNRRREDEEKRIAEALDRWLEDETSADLEGELRSLRPMMAALHEALPPETADPAFRDTLRSRLLQPIRPTILARVRTALVSLISPPLAGEGSRAWPRSFNLAGAVAMLLVAFTLGVFYYRQMPQLAPGPSEPAIVAESAKRAADAQTGSVAPAPNEPSPVAAAAASEGRQAVEPTSAAEAPTLALKQQAEPQPPAAANSESTPAAPAAADTEATQEDSAPAQSTPAPQSTAVEEPAQKAAVATPAPAEAPKPEGTPAPSGATTALAMLPPIDAVDEDVAAKSVAVDGAGTMADGMGAGASRSLTTLEASVGSESPRPSQVALTYDISTSWPEVPASAPVYRLSPASPTLAEAQALAQSLGLDPDRMTVADAGRFTAESGALEFILGADGTLVYDDRSHEGLGTYSVLSDPQLIATAQGWLQDKGLLPGDAEATVLPPQDGVPYRVVVLRPSGIRMLGAGPRVEVGVSPSGKVVHLMRWWPQMELVGDYPARTADDLRQAAVAGEGKLVLDPPVAAESIHGRVTVTKADIGYLLTYTLDGQGYLQPALVMEGAARLDSASSPQMPADEMRRLLAQTYHAKVTLPVIDERYETTYSVQFKLEASPPQAPTTLGRHAYPSPTPVDPAWVEDLGTRLGMAGEPVVTTPEAQVDAQTRQFEMRSADGFVLRITDGPPGATTEEWAYSREGTPEATPDEQLSGGLSEDDLLAAATDWLTKRQLLTPDLGPIRAVYSGPDMTVVSSGAQVDGVALLNQDALVLTLTPAGEVISATRFRLPTEAAESLTLLSPDEALASIQAGNGQIKLDVPVLSRDQIRSQGARIQSFKLAYVPSYTPGALQPVFEPYYLFGGVMEIEAGAGGARQTASFLVTLPAWRR